MWPQVESRLFKYIWGINCHWVSFLGQSNSTVRFHWNSHWGEGPCQYSAGSHQDGVLVVYGESLFQLVRITQVSCSVMSNSLLPHGLYSPWNSLGKNTGLGIHSLLQGIFPTQGSNPGLPHCSRFFTSWATRETQFIHSTNIYWASYQLPGKRRFTMN